MADPTADPSPIAAVWQDDFLAWFESFGKIKLATPTDADEIKLERPVANWYQRRVHEAIMYCKKNRLPVRIIGLKPRQRGSSSIFTAYLYHTCCVANTRGCIIGGAHFQGKNLLQMVKRYSKHDPYFNAAPWDETNDPGLEISPSEVLDKMARWKNGSEIDQITAANGEAGRSATYEFVLATEVAYWSNEGVADARTVLSGLINAVHPKAGTSVIIESTACGAAGDFYDRYRNAMSLEEFKDAHAGNRPMGYIKVFAPWFFFPELTLPVDFAWFESTLTEDEKSYLSLVYEEYHISLSMGQMAWRRQKISDDYSGDENLFEQDYPRNEQTAFVSSGRKRFDQLSIIRMRKEAGSVPMRWGNLMETPDAFAPRRFKVIFHESGPGSSTVQLWEEPRPNHSYIIPIDVAKGASGTISKDPDHHAVIVIRAGFWEKGQWNPPAVVARLASLGQRNQPECRWDVLGVLDAKIRLLSLFYGGASSGVITVPESNMDGGLIESLKQMDVPILRRPVFNRATQTNSLEFGWRTGVDTRPRIVESVAKAVRDGRTEGSGIDIWCRWLLDELSDAATIDGKVQAASGHDDQWMALGIGLCTLDAATPYVPFRKPRIMQHSTENRFARAAGYS